MDKFNPFRIPKTNKVVAAVRSFPVWYKPNFRPGITNPEDWYVVKLSGDRTGYVQSKFMV